MTLSNEKIIGLQVALRTTRTLASLPSEEAEDLIQSTIQRICSVPLDRLPVDDDGLRLYAFRILKNITIEYYRKNSIEYRHRERVLQKNPKTPESPITKLIEREQAELFREVINKLLSTYEKIIIFQVILEKKSLTQVCQDLDISYSKGRHLLKDGLAKISSSLKGYYLNE